MTTCDVYLRLSDLRPCDACRAARRECEHNSLAAKEKLLRDFAARLGWDVARVETENDVNGGGKLRPASAYKRQRVKKANGEWAATPDGRPVWRTLRPSFRRVLGDIDAGRAGAVVAEDLDRTFRDPVDAEDFIDTMQASGANARSLSGSLTFTNGGTDGEITMARVMVAMAWKSSRDTARRVAQSRQRRAEAGRSGGGRRPFGFRQVDGELMVDEAEAREIRLWAAAVLASPVSHKDRSDPHRPDDGQSLKAIARMMRERDFPTVTGCPWHPETVRDILVRPMTGGVSARDVTPHGIKFTEIPVESPPAWMTDPILPRETWEAVRDRLLDPGRKTTTGNAVRWLGSGIYRCGYVVSCVVATREEVRCNAVLRVSGSGNRTPRYVCPEFSHVGRDARALDTHVGGAVCARLSEPDAEGLLRPPPRAGIDANAVRREIRQLQDRGATQARLHAAGTLTDADLAAGAAYRKERMAALNGMLAATTEADMLAEFRDRPDVIDVWLALPLSRKRGVLSALMTVTVLPAGRGRGFDPAGVRLASHTSA
jgi:site-specific DNA recombinase